ncbi:MAG: SAM-dependent methyltransferase [Chloroflexi bacterium]|nr:SAM-dependent methyltransferase [Chloroflexota bacterium]
MTPVEEILRSRIRAAGRITFAEFMETALYDPGCGYYTRPGRISARGDYYTSPSIHPAFGALICIQLCEMWLLLERPREFRCVEFGAESGTLASDIQAYAGRLNEDFARSLRYMGVDRAQASPDCPEPGSLRQLAEAGELDAGGVGCVLSNELLDAFPVHRFVIRSGTVRELYVHMSGDSFDMQEGDPSSPEIERRVSGYLSRLPEGFTGEVRLGIDEWAGVVSSSLERGFALTVDFGFERDALYSPARSSGTLRCYYRHTETGDPFRHVGEQDMAAHVDFTEVDAALGRAGFVSVGHASQREFLGRLGAGAFLSRLAQSVDSPAELLRNRAAILELVKPEGLGGFRVAIHGKGVAAGDAVLTGLVGSRDSDLGNLPVPVLAQDEDRVPMLEGRYPHAVREFTATWEELFRE